MESRTWSWDKTSYDGEARGTPRRRKQHYKQPAEAGACSLLTRHAYRMKHRSNVLALFAIPPKPPCWGRQAWTDCLQLRYCIRRSARLLGSVSCPGRTLDRHAIQTHGDYQSDTYQDYCDYSSFQALVAATEAKMHMGAHSQTGL
ncbi:Hypothetical predicted protein [Pelobates cultripes]|uniref:Uncharacterized protein n=1 Tax=Pelobates cultripes TaxID=61616 RepID=A0AAD1TCB1_PELCU|nr:Hypothetical predicted protein [Pelobates cultripes]